MDSEKLFIPNKCKVGFQLRHGTYTGKLGYIIYNDGKQWRKEPSWESWRHKVGQVNYEYFNGVRQETIIEGVEPIEFANEPTSGFVLNKKVGGYSTGWNHRQTYSRVYDPRGWEFEITVENLLFILDECSSIKGKGLEGDFVYSWSGKDLVLLPVDCNDYKLSTNFTKLQDKKISTKELKEGLVYLTNKMDRLVYLGKYDCYEHTWAIKLGTTPEKRHIFMREDNKEFVFLKSISTIKEKVSDDLYDGFAEELDRLLNKSPHVSKPIRYDFIDIDENEKIDSYYDKYYFKGKEYTGYYSSGVGVTLKLRDEYWNNSIIVPFEEFYKNYKKRVLVFENNYKLNV